MNIIDVSYKGSIFWVKVNGGLVSVDFDFDALPLDVPVLPCRRRVLAGESVVFVMHA